jgi:hypothetical protein
MKTKLCAILFGISMMLGCAAKGRLYPVQGPLAAQSPVSVYIVKFNGAFAASGNVTITIDDGEVCIGRWAPVPRNQPAATTPNEAAQMWDTVYGAGFYVAHVLGNPLVRAVITGDQGTILNVEVSKFRNEAGAFSGVARDNRGNIYKLDF